MTDKPKRARTKRAITYEQLMEAATAYIAETRPRLSDSSTVAKFMAPLLAGQEQEMLFSIPVDTKNQAVCAPILTTKGILDQSMSHPREVFKGAIRHNAAKILLAHNHPSGDPTPSADDIAVTERMIAVGNILGIHVLDHVIIGVATEKRRGYASIRELGLCNFEQT